MDRTPMDAALDAHGAAAQRCRGATTPAEAQAAIRALQDAYARLLDTITARISEGTAVDQELFGRIAGEHRAAFEHAHGLVDAYLRTLTRNPR